MIRKSSKNKEREVVAHKENDDFIIDATYSHVVKRGTTLIIRHNTWLS